MACSGHCEVQIYDFDFGDVQLELISPKGGEYEPCARPSRDAIAAAILAEFAKANPPKWQDTPSDTRGCQGDDCVCIPCEPPADAWTVWSAYDLTPFEIRSGSTTLAGPDIVSPAVPCIWKVSGEYWVCSAWTRGDCMPKPKRTQRPENPKRPKRAK